MQHLAKSANFNFMCENPPIPVSRENPLKWKYNIISHWKYKYKKDRKENNFVLFKIPFVQMSMCAS